MYFCWFSSQFLLLKNKHTSSTKMLALQSSSFCIICLFPVENATWRGVRSQVKKRRKNPHRLDLHPSQEESKRTLLFRLRLPSAAVLQTRKWNSANLEWIVSSTALIFTLLCKRSSHIVTSPLLAARWSAVKNKAEKHGKDITNSWIFCIYFRTVLKQNLDGL